MVGIDVIRELVADGLFIKSRKQDAQGVYVLENPINQMGKAAE